MVMLKLYGMVDDVSAEEMVSIVADQWPRMLNDGERG